MPNCDSELVLGEGRYGLAKILLSLADFQDNFPGEAKERDIWWKLFVLAGVCWCYVAARIERERRRRATVPAGYCSREREGEEQLAPREASNLIVASCLTITDTGFSFIEMTDLTPKEIS